MYIPRRSAVDNMIFHPSEPRVIASLDWELSTIGDKFTDFAYNAMLWRIDADLFRGFKGLDPELRLWRRSDGISQASRKTGATESNSDD